MMEHTQHKVHTAELMLLSANGADVHKDYRRDGRITGKGRYGVYKDAPVRYLRFNPHNLKVYSKQTSRKLAVGDCESLADFRLHVADWARAEDVPKEAICFSRVDFKVDCCVDEGAEWFRQMCDMLILAFNIKHNVKEKDQYYGETQTTMRHKNNKTQWGHFALECYNKGIQKENCEARWRLELRYIQPRKDKEQKYYADILPMLDELRAELRTLPDYYERAQTAMNTTLAERFRESVEGSGGAVRLNEFIFLNRDRVFSWRQLKELFVTLGNPNPDNAVRNYHRGRKTHNFITKKEFATFVDMVDNCIKIWVKNDTKLGEFFEARNGASPEKSTGVPF